MKSFAVTTLLSLFSITSAVAGTTSYSCKTPYDNKSVNRVVTATLTDYPGKSVAYIDRSYELTCEKVVRAAIAPKKNEWIPIATCNDNLIGGGYKVKIKRGGPFNVTVASVIEEYNPALYGSGDVVRANLICKVSVR